MWVSVIKKFLMYWDYVKILKGEDGAEDTGITFMQNKEMPHIRYVTGDKGGILNKKCSCGNCSPVLRIYPERNNDWI